MTLEMQKICKSFGVVRVLKDVDFSVKEGEICALIGENGAGKSTLMNILGGVLPPDSGRIFLDGNPVSFRNPAESLSAGIAFIHQELNLINDLTIYENMFLGRELKKKNGFLDADAMRKQTREIFDKMDFRLDPMTMVRDLDSSYKQIVEIFRALMMNASIIIMDEPTASLTDSEVERVFEMMRTLKLHGVGIVFISHKLKEVMTICDRFTVLRDGAMVKDGLISETSADDLALHMVGHEIRVESVRRDCQREREILRVEHLSDETAFRDVSFSAYAGEVLGVTGLLGDGRSELFQTIFGVRGDYGGRICVEGKPVHIGSPMQSRRLGIGYVPRNRKENGIIKDMSILENGTVVTLAEYLRRGLIDRGRQNGDFDRQAERLHIKLGKKSDLITSLSGGNQQKVVLAKWLNANPKLLVLDNPTQGVDVGAKEEIYNIILKLAGAGVAVVVLSSEVQEIIRLCDRALVMYHGRVLGEVCGETMNEHDIMRLATGGISTGIGGENE